MRKSKLFVCLLPVLTLSSITLPLVASCSKKTPTEEEQEVTLDKSLSFTCTSTFKVTKPSPNGFFQIKVDDNIYDLNRSVAFFHIINKSNSELKLQPTNISFNKDIHKYTIEYNNGDKVIYSKSWFLASDSDLTIEIDKKSSGFDYFHRFNPTLKIIAKKAGQPIKDVKWEYDLLDSHVKSYLDYFEIDENDSTTTMTLKKTQVFEDTGIYVWAIDTDNNKIGIKIPIYKFISPQFRAVASSAELNTRNTSTLSLEFDSGSYLGLGFKVAWNLFNSSGSPLNVAISDGEYESASGIKYTYKKGQQVPLTSINFNIKSTRERIYGKDNDGLNWLLGEDAGKEKTEQLGIFSGSKTIKDELLKLKLNSDYNSPIDGQVRYQAVLYSPNDIKLGVSYNTTNNKLNYETQLKNLSINQNYKQDLFFPKSDSQSGDICKIYFSFTPYTHDNDYSLYFDKDSEKRYNGFSEIIHTLPGGDKTPGQQEIGGQQHGGTTAVGKYLLENEISGEAYKRPVVLSKGSQEAKDLRITDQVWDEESGGREWCLYVKLQNSLYLPILNETGEEPETKSIEIKPIIVAHNNKTGIDERFAIGLNILNGNRIINISNPKYISSDGTLDLFKAASDTGLKKLKYQSEIYVPRQIIRTPGKAPTHIVRIKRFDNPLIQPSSADAQTMAQFADIIRHVSFQKHSLVEEFTSGVRIGEENNATGAFAGCDHLTTVDLQNCEKLKIIGNYSFAYSSSAFDPKVQSFLYQDIHVPKSVTTIGDFAFERYKMLYRIIIDNGYQEIDPKQPITTKLTIGKNSFWECKFLKAVADIPVKDPSGKYVTKLTTIGPDAFRGCERLSLFSFDNITSIGTAAFADTDLLSNIDFSNNVNSNVFKLSTGSIDYNYIFSVSTGAKLTKNIQFGGQDAPLKISTTVGETRFFPLMTDQATSAGVILKQDNVKLSNISCKENVYTGSKINELNPEKLNIYELNEGSLYVSSELKDLTFTNSVIHKEMINVVTYKEDPTTHEMKPYSAPSLSNIKSLSFVSPKGCENFSAQKEKQAETIFKRDSASSTDWTTTKEAINKLQSITYVFDPIGEKVSKEEYVENISGIYFSSLALNYLVYYDQSSILTINIECSAGPKSDTTIGSSTTFELMKKLIYQTLQCYKNENLIKRVYDESYDMNTVISWVLLPDEEK